MLNSQQIIEEELLKLEHTKGKPAQVGYDLSLKAVQRVGTSISNNPYNVSKDGKIGKIKSYCIH